jgi:outer membrane protein assembly factor BamB
VWVKTLSESEPREADRGARPEAQRERVLVARAEREPAVRHEVPARRRSQPMAWPTLGVRLAAALAVAQLGCSGTQARQVGCSKDTDCKDPRVCERGVCVDPRPIGQSEVVVTRDDAGVAKSSPVKGPPAFAMFGGDARHSGRRAGAAPLKQPKELWKVDVKGAVVGSPTIGPDGTIYVASHDGSLYAIDGKGAIKWSFKTGDRSWSTPAVAQDGTIYIGSDDDHLYAIKADGSLKWKLRLGDCDPKGFGPESSRCDVDGGPTIGPDGTIYTGGDGIHAVWADGTLRWKLATAEHVASTPALAADGTVYAGSQDDALYAVAADGTKKWELRTGDDVDATPSIGADGTIYVGSDDHTLYAITPKGDVAWRVITGGDIRGGAAIAANGTIYVGSYDKKLYAIGPSGRVQWKLSAADKIQSTPGIATNGIILFGAQDEHVYAVAPDGTLRWHLALAADVDTTPAIASDGTLYVAGDDGHLHAFR